MLANQESSNVTPIVVVTGGSDGLGKAIVVAFCRQGATVVMLARNEERLNGAATELTDAGHRVIPLVADVTNDASVKNAVEQIANDLGRVACGSTTWANPLEPQ